MTKFAKYITGLVACVALVMSGMPAANAQSTSGYPRRSASHITTATTTTPFSSTLYVSSVVIMVNSATSGTVAILNKEGTAKTLYKSASLSAAASYTINLGPRDAAVLMTSGIDIVTTGTINVDVFITGYAP